MGTEFWWFYDTIAGAILLVSIFIGAKKGAMKSLFITISMLLGVFLGYAISGAAADSLYKGTFLKGSVSKLEKVMESDTFITKFSAQLESMGYSLKVDREKLQKALDKTDKPIDESVAYYINNVNARPLEDDEDILIEKVDKCYARTIAAIISDASMSKFVSEYAADFIMGDSSGMQELVPMFKEDETVTPAANYIAKNYVAPAYKVICHLVSFVIVFAALFLLVLASFNAFTSNRENGFTGPASHVVGGIIGIVTAIGAVFAAAVIVRLWAVMGSNEMLFFNNDVVDQTYVFKYFYDVAQKMQ